MLLSPSFRRLTAFCFSSRERYQRWCCESRAEVGNATESWKTTLLVKSCHMRKPWREEGVFVTASVARGRWNHSGRAAS